MRARRVVRLIGRLAAWSVWALAIVAVVAWATGRGVSDRTAWSQWLRWIPTPAVIGLLLIGLAAARVGPSPRWRRRRTTVVAFGLAAVVVFFGFVEHRLLRIPAARPQGVVLTVWHLGFRRTNDAMRSQCQRAVHDLLADVTLLVDGHDVRGDLVAALPEGVQGIIRGRFTLITRLPVHEARTLVGTEQLDVAQFRLDDGHGGFVLHAVDLPSDPSLPRHDVAIRLRRLLDEAGAAAPDFVAGDFNIPRGSRSITRAFPGLHHAYGDGGHGYGATFPRVFPLFHLDHLLLAGGWHASRYDLVDPGLGRHWAQRAWLVRTPPPP